MTASGEGEHFVKGRAEIGVDLPVMVLREQELALLNERLGGGGSQMLVGGAGHGNYGLVAVGAELVEYALLRPVRLRQHHANATALDEVFRHAGEVGEGLADAQDVGQVQVAGLVNLPNNADRVVGVVALLALLAVAPVDSGDRARTEWDCPGAVVARPRGSASMGPQV